jgi:hypothetical protein
VAALVLAIGAGGGMAGAAVAAGGSAAGEVSASFSTVSSWNGGYTADFIVTNHSSAPTTGWTLVFDLPKGASIVSSWNGTVSQSGSVVTVRNASYNGKLTAGEGAIFGFQASYTGAYQAPGGCTINGLAICSGTTVGGTSGGGTTTATGTTTTGTTTTGTTRTGTTRTGTTSTGTTSTGTTSTGTGTGTTSSTSPPAGEGSVSSDMAVTDDWGSGYNANFTITNHGSQAISHWTLTFALPAGMALQDSWSGSATVSGSTVTVTNAAWNGTIAPGGTAVFGAEFNGGDRRPTGCTIDGSSAGCTIEPGGSTSTTTTTGSTTTGTTGAGTNTGGEGSTGDGYQAPGTTPTCGTIPGDAGSVPFAPYTDVTLYPEINLADTACNTGIHEFSIAFFTGNGCTPVMAGASYQNPELQADIRNLRAIGGDAIGSFGGEAGQELAESCTNVTALAQAYENVINYYGFTQVDFDIEGAATGDNAGIQRRVQAVQLAEAAETAAGHPFTVSLTLPVLPTGLPNWSNQNEVGIVQSMAQVAPVKVVNIMTMDYGESWPSPATSTSTDQMGNLAIQAAQATETELAGIFPQDITAQLWKMIGITPLIGVNDQADEVFTPGDATQVAGWATSHGIGRLAFWSTTKDQQCPGDANEGDANTCSSVTQTPWEFSSIFEKA